MKVAAHTTKLLSKVPLPDEIGTVHDSAIVIDLGSGTTRIGFSGDDAPRLEAPTVVGQHKDGTVDCFAKAYKQRANADVEVSNVMERGIVKDWKGMEHILSHIYDLLHLSNDPNAPILISEAALVPKEQREHMVQYLFERVNVQYLYFSSAPVLSLFASGRSTGTVVEMGHGTCHTVPVFEGFGLFHSILQLDFAGSDLTKVVKDMIEAAGARFTPEYAMDIAQFVKETYCVAMPDKHKYTIAVADSNRNDVVHHTLPDGTTITLGTERYKPVEALFNPSVLGFEGMKGIHALTAESVGKCDPDIKETLLSNIVLSGGSSLFKNLAERLHRDVEEEVKRQSIIPAKEPPFRARVFAGTERRNAAWVGGSIFASLPTVQDMWISKAEYDEMGADVRNSIGHRNCF